MKNHLPKQLHKEMLLWADFFNSRDFDFFSEQHLGACKEIQLTDAIQKINEIQSVFAYEFEVRRFEVGEVRFY